MAKPGNAALSLPAVFDVLAHVTQQTQHGRRGVLGG